MALPLLRPRWVFLRTPPVITFLVPVRTPFPDIAVHIIQPEGIGRVRADGTGAAQERTLIAHIEKPAAPIAKEVSAVVKGTVRSRPAGVFPLRLRRQAVSPAGALLLREARQRPAEFHGLVPGNVFHWEPPGVQTGYHFLAGSVRRKAAGVRTHDPLEFLLRHAKAP